MERKALQVSNSGIEIASADEHGKITYAEGYDAEKVMEVIVQWGVTLLNQNPAPEAQFHCGLMLMTDTKWEHVDSIQLGAGAGLDEGTDPPTPNPNNTFPNAPGPSSEEANRPNTDKRTADFEKIVGLCSTFEGNFDLIGDEAMEVPMTAQDAQRRGHVLLGQIHDIAHQHKGEEGFKEILNHVSTTFIPLTRDSLKDIHRIAADRVRLPGGIEGGTDLEGQSDLHGVVGK